jgi:hypothetical protein
MVPDENVKKIFIRYLYIFCALYKNIFAIEKFLIKARGRSNFPEAPEYGKMEKHTWSVRSKDEE